MAIPRIIKFGHKVTLLSISLILLTGASITGVTAFQFRRQLYDHEFSSAFTVYLAAVNYLSGHYKSKGDRFVRPSLNYVLNEKFLRLEGAGSELITHHLTRLVIYDREGELVYEYAENGVKEAARRLPPEFLPRAYERSYDASTRLLRVAGPITEDGSVPGSVIMVFPSNIEREVRALYLKSLVIMCAVCVAAMALSFLFSRRVLAPIEALTQAARKVHEGDLDQQVAVSTHDEIGLLTDTFNQMVSSLVRRIALMHRMQEWTVRISKQFDVERLYDGLTEMFERLASARFSRLYVAGPQEGPLALVRERGAAHLGVRTGMAQRAHDAGQIFYLNRGGVVDTEPAGPTELALPLRVGAKRIGALHLGPPSGGLLYEEETLTTLQTLGQHAATALENALLYKELAERERFQQEMRWAREIQRSLLPRTVPDIPGYELFGLSSPASEVGGDYYDFVPTIGQHWNVLVGDVSGKGVPAALIMSIVRSLIHTYVEFAASPRDILKRVNRILSPDLEAEMFVTAASLNLDPRAHRLQVVRAGHEPVMVLRGGRVLRLQPRGSALGLLDMGEFEASLEEMNFELQPRDVVVMYTDGVTETQNEDREEFGYDRLEQVLLAHADRPLADVAAAILRAIQEFSQGRPPHDDITIVALRRAA